MPSTATDGGVTVNSAGLVQIVPIGRGQTNSTRGRGTVEGNGVRTGASRPIAPVGPVRRLDCGIGVGPARCRGSRATRLCGLSGRTRRSPGSHLLRARSSTACGASPRTPPPSPVLATAEPRTGGWSGRPPESPRRAAAPGLSVRGAEEAAPGSLSVGECAPARGPCRSAYRRMTDVRLDQRDRSRR